MAKFFATFSLSAEVEVEADSHEEAAALFRQTLTPLDSTTKLTLTPEGNGIPLELIHPLTTIGLMGEVSGPLG